MRRYIPLLITLGVYSAQSSASTQWLHDNLSGLGFSPDDWAPTLTTEAVDRPLWSADLQAFTVELDDEANCDPRPECARVVISGPLEIAVSPGAVAMVFEHSGLENVEATWTFSRKEGEPITQTRSSRQPRTAAFLPPRTTTIRVESNNPWALTGIRTYSAKHFDNEFVGEIDVTNTFSRGNLVVPDPVNEAFIYRVVSGVLEQSADRGKTWIGLDVPLDGLTDVAMNPVGSHIVVAVSSDGLARSTDRGASWTVVVDRPFSAAAQMHWSPNTETQLLLADGVEVLLSSDAGETWESLPSLPEGYAQIAGARESDIWVLGESGRLYLFKDGLWSPDPRWSFVNITDASVTNCDLVALVDGRLWRVDHGLGYPAVPTAIGQAGVLTDMTTSGRTCTMTLLSDDGRLIETGSRLNWGLTRVLPDGIRPVSIEQHFGPRFDFKGPAYLLTNDEVLVVDRRAEDTCLQNTCSYRLPFVRTGFYVARLDLPPDSKEGLFGMSLDASPRQGFAAGAVLPAGGKQPGFVGFGIDTPGLVRLKIDEYTGNINLLTLELRRIQDDGGRSTVWGPEVFPSHSTLDIHVPEAGRYVLSIRSGNEDPTGRFGVSLTAGSFGHGVDLGGWITQGDQSPFIAYDNSSGVSEFTINARDSFGEAGASLPELSVSFQVPGGDRIPVYPTALENVAHIAGDVDRITDRFQNQTFDASADTSLSGDGRTVGVMIRRFPGDDDIDLYEWNDGALRVRNEVTTIANGGTFPLNPLAVSENGDVFVFTRQDEPFVYLHEDGATRAIELPDPKIEQPNPSLILDDSLIYLINGYDRGTDSPAYVYDLRDELWTLLPDVFHGSVIPRDSGTILRVATSTGTVAVVEVDLFLGMDIYRREPQIPQERAGNPVKVTAHDVSDDGSTIVFEVTERHPHTDRIQFQRLFAFDKPTRSWTLISTDKDGRELQLLASQPRVSGDGRFVFFAVPEASESGERHPINSVDYSIGYAILRKDLLTGDLRRVIDRVSSPEILESDDAGSSLVFRTIDSSLVPYDTNGQDTFVWHEHVGASVEKQF